MAASGHAISCSSNSAPAAPIDLPGTQTSSQEVRERLWIGRMRLKVGFEGQPHTCCGSGMAPIDRLPRGTGWLGRRPKGLGDAKTAASLLTG